MRPLTLGLLGHLILSACSSPPAQDTPPSGHVTVFEGARVIVGDGSAPIAAGKSADFVVLDANPLDDITNTRRIARVYLRGKEVDRARMRAGWTGTRVN